MTDVDAALARMDTDADLPSEPGVTTFVAFPNGRPSSVNPIVPYAKWNRWINAQRRVQARFNKEICGLIPVDCRACGQLFHRTKIQQVNCPVCIEAIRAPKGVRPAREGGEYGEA